MKKSKLTVKLVSLVLLAISCAIIFQQKAVASSVTASGITVSPAIINLDLQKDQSSNSFDITLTNNTNRSITLTISSLDFKSLNDTGGITFIGSSVTESARKHALAAWIKTPTDPITIAANQAKKVAIVINNRSDLGPGGHYAAVLYTIADVGNTNSAVKVNVNQVASTLVFVRKIDGALFGLHLNKFRVTFSWFHLPRTIDLAFTNTGNIQTVPRGLITVTAPSGKEVSRAQINTDSTLVLPDTTRIYGTQLFRTGSAWLPGIYKVHVTYHSDDIAKIQTADVNFTYVNLLGILELVIGIYIIKKYYRKVVHSVIKKTKKQVKKWLN